MTNEPPTDSAQPDEAATTSGDGLVARGAVAWLFSNFVVLGATVVTGALVARHLGPIGKATVSTTNYLVSLIGVGCALGLGEASVALLGRRQDRRQVALSSTLAMTTLAGALGGGVAVALLATGLIDLDGLGPIGFVAAGLAVPGGALTTVLTRLSEANRRITMAAAARAGAVLIGLVATVVLLYPAALGADGALIAIALSAWIGPAIILTGLSRTGLSLRPAFHPGYSRDAIRIGAPVLVASVLTAASARLDILPVLFIEGQSAAGLYAVALTISDVLVYGAVALATSAAPRMASLSDHETHAYAMRAARATVAATLLLTTLLGSTMWLVIPLLYGADFAPAIAPALVLLLGGVPSCLQFLLARLLTARGDGRPLAISYAVSLLVMLGADVVLVPALGTVGAALGSIIGSTAGAGTIVMTIRRSAGGQSTFVAMVPRAADVAGVTETIYRVIAGFGRRVLGRTT